MNQITQNKSRILTKLTDWDTLSFIFACACCIILPLYVWYVPPFMILWGISRLLGFRVKKDPVNLINRDIKWLAISFILFYSWQMIGIIYSENKIAALNIFLSRLSLIFFPLVLIIPGEKISKYIKVILKLFTVSTLLFIVFCFINAFYNSVSFQNGKLIFDSFPLKGYWEGYFYGSFFAINQHPTYLAMFVIMAALIAFESWFDRINSKRQRIFWLIAGIFLVFSLYYISSRSGIMAAILVIPVYFFYKLKSLKSRIYLGLVVLILCFGLLTVVRQNERIRIFLHEISGDSFKKRISEDVRIGIWKSSIHVFRENMILGVGIGDLRNELSQEYKTSVNEELAKNYYNVHNQFLEILVEEGIIGFVLFLLVLFCITYIAISRKNIMYGLFLFMMLIFFMFETILYRLPGVAFFSLFSFLLLHLKPKKM
jgi:O-antigen ligase